MGLVTTARGQSIVRRLLDEAFNQGNVAIVDELVAPDGVSHHPGWGLPANRIGLKQLIAIFRTAFPDLQCSVGDEISLGDKVAAHWTMRGTHDGQFLGNSPTNRPVVAQGFIYARLENGQVIENWIMVDQMGVLQQLGLVPPPPRRSQALEES